MIVLNKREAEIVFIDQLGSDVFSMWVKDEKTASKGKAGQFVSLYCSNETRLLPRPISLCEINKKEGLIRLVYRIVGKGTQEFSKLKVKDRIKILGPFGNGFTLEGKDVLIVGGGIGIPPLLELAKPLKVNPKIVLGYKDEVFLDKDFKKYGKVYISTEDGSLGTKGNVIDAIVENKLDGDMIFACGPMPMLRGLKDYGEKNKIRAQFSLEERMACGIGACLSCVCKTKEKDPHTNVKNTRICKEGPVFYADKIDI